MGIEAPQLDVTPKVCPVCDATVALGVLTGVCESIDDKTGKSKCFDVIKPLEAGSAKAVDVLADVLVEVGQDDVNSVLDRMNFLIYQATAKAKERLIAKGILNKDGTPKDVI